MGAHPCPLQAVSCSNPSTPPSPLCPQSPVPRQPQETFAGGKARTEVTPLLWNQEIPGEQVSGLSAGCCGQRVVSL